MDKERVFVVGVGMTKFIKPKDSNPDYPQMAAQALNRALRDANLSLKKVQAAAIGYVFGDSTCGQRQYLLTRALYQVGMEGIPVYNINNNCATGSSALHMASKLIEGRINNCVLALGFQKMQRGALSMKYADRTNPLDKVFNRTMQLVKQPSKAPFAPQFFGNAGLQHMKQHGTLAMHFGMIAQKNHKHSLNNPYSQFRQGHSLNKIMESQHIHGPLTKLQCCPTSDGAAAAILCNLKTVKQLGLQDQAIQILAIQMTTDKKQMFDNLKQLVGYGMAKQCAQKVYSKANVSPKDINVVELHDCFSANQLITYQALGLCPQGKAGQFIQKKQNTYGGKVVVNPSGGLISKGHPLGATGLAQCAQLNWQLRGIAQKRQVFNAKLALQHNLGLGGACVIALYKKYNNNKSKGTSDPVVLQKLQKTQLPMARL